MILALAGLCAGGAILSYLLAGGGAEIPEAEAGLVAPPGLAAGEFLRGGTLAEGGMGREQADEPARGSGDVLDETGGLRRSGFAEAAPAGKVVVMQNAAGGTPRRRVTALRDGAQTTGADEPFTYAPEQNDGESSWWTAAGAGGAGDVFENVPLAPTGAARARARMRRSQPNGDGAGIFQNAEGAEQNGGNGVTPNSLQPAKLAFAEEGAESQGERAGIAGGAKFPGGAEVPEVPEPARRPWPTGVLTAEQQLYRSQVGWQAFDQWTKEEAFAMMEDAEGER
jgi:hypothetical protein